MRPVSLLAEHDHDDEPLPSAGSTYGVKNRQFGDTGRPYSKQSPSAFLQSHFQGGEVGPHQNPTLSPDPTPSPVPLRLVETCLCGVSVCWREKKERGCLVTIDGGIEGWCFRSIQVRRVPLWSGLLTTEILAEKKSYQRTRPVPSSPQIPQ